MVVKGKGHQHPKKGFFGDLIVQVRIKGWENECSS
jgi:DnaJ-class molecular chaperone